MPVLANLRLVEGIRLDPDPLISLYAQLGETGAERVIRRSVEELAARLSEMLVLADDGNQSGLVQAGRIMRRLAEEVGMATLARVAGDVIRATEAGDITAQAATLARLVRIGERSLSAVWDLHDSVT